jgi:very-short-patch-repair endonuclease
MKRADANTLKRARRLRRVEPSAGERAMWSLMRKLNQRGAGFRREAAIGSWAFDFAWLEQRLLVEVDGGVHAMPQVAERDARKDAWAQSHGWRIIRFSSEAVVCRPQEVRKAILAAVPPLPRDPPPRPRRNARTPWTKPTLSAGEGRISEGNPG